MAALRKRHSASKSGYRASRPNRSIDLENSGAYGASGERDAHGLRQLSHFHAGLFENGFEEAFQALLGKILGIIEAAEPGCQE